MDVTERETPTMRRLLVVLWCVALGACGGGNGPGDQQAEVANPASVYCEEQGGTVEIRTDDAGEQHGVCVFEDGSECDEWAFYRGECQPGVPATDIEVTVFFTNQGMGDPCGEVFPVPRQVPEQDPVTGAVAALVAGPDTAERAEGYGGWFSAETRDVVRSVDVVGGTAVVDFTDLRQIIPNASTSCGSAALLAQLDTTLRQFPDVQATYYMVNGDAPAFYEWLQLDAPEPPSDPSRALTAG